MTGPPTLADLMADPDELDAAGQQRKRLDTERHRADDWPATKQHHVTHPPT